MHSKIACDHNDHDHYADDVKDIHYFTPIEKPSDSTSLVAIQQLQRLRARSEQKRSPGVRSSKRDELAISLPALCRTLYLIVYAAGPTSCVGVVAHLDGFAMICLSRRHDRCTQAVPGCQRRFGATRDLKELRSQLYDQNKLADNPIITAND
jgi:hypothetical protein